METAIFGLGVRVYGKVGAQIMTGLNTYSRIMENQIDETLSQMETSMMLGWTVVLGVRDLQGGILQHVIMGDYRMLPGFELPPRPVSGAAGS